MDLFRKEYRSYVYARWFHLIAWLCMLPIGISATIFMLWCGYFWERLSVPHTSILFGYIIMSIPLLAIGALIESGLDNVQ